MLDLSDFEKYLISNLPKVSSFHPHYEDALHRMLYAGGKRFRPSLLLSIVQSCQPELFENAYPIASAIEYLHTYSLIHDDLPLMDNADTRRGEKTLHIVYDDVTAVLVGDALNTHAFELIADAPLDDSVKIALVKELAHNGGTHGMVLGQAIDCHFEDHPLTLKQLQFLHENKTGKLIAASLKMGGIISNLDTQINNKLYQVGIDLGLLFQIEDDIIDATMSEEDAGKPTQNDAHKNSYITILGLEKSLDERNTLKSKLLNDAKQFDTPITHVLVNIITSYFK